MVKMTSLCWSCRIRQKEKKNNPQSKIYQFHSCSHFTCLFFQLYNRATLRYQGHISQGSLNERTDRICLSVCMYVYEWLSGCGPSNNVCLLKEIPRTQYCSVHYTDVSVVSCPFGSPRKLQVFSPPWKPQKRGSNTSKDWISNRVDELASEREDKHAKSKSFLLPFYVGCHSRVWSRVWVGLPTSKDSGFRVGLPLQII